MVFPDPIMKKSVEKEFDVTSHFAVSLFYKNKLTVIKDYGKQDFKQHSPLESNLGIIVLISDKWSQESTT